MLAHLDKGVPLDQFKVLVMPADLPKLSAEQKARLDRFTAGGGVIIRAGKAEPGIAARAEAAAGGPRLSLEPRGYVLGQLTRKPDGRTFILHLLNYDQPGPGRERESPAGPERAGRSGRKQRPEPLGGKGPFTGRGPASVRLAFLCTAASPSSLWAGSSTTPWWFSRLDRGRSLKLTRHVGNRNPNFSCEWLRIIHFTDGDDITLCALLLVPSGLHQRCFASRRYAAFSTGRPASIHPCLPSG